MGTKDAACAMFWLSGMCIGAGFAGDQESTFVVGALLSILAGFYHKRFNT